MHISGGWGGWAAGLRGLEPCAGGPAAQHQALPAPASAGCRAALHPPPTPPRLSRRPPRQGRRRAGCGYQHQHRHGHRGGRRLGGAPDPGHARGDGCAAGLGAYQAGVRAAAGCCCCRPLAHSLGLLPPLCLPAQRASWRASWRTSGARRGARAGPRTAPRPRCGASASAGACVETERGRLLHLSSAAHQPSSQRLTHPPSTADHQLPTLTHPPWQDIDDLERRHFSYFAFEGGSGATRWMHEVRPLALRGGRSCGAGGGSDWSGGVRACEPGTLQPSRGAGRLPAP